MEHGEKTKEKRRIVIVLGMHRSGTSALSRSLMALGLSLGQSLLDPLPDNPMGFWEDKEILAINEEVLAASGSSWDSFAPPGLSLKEAKMVSLLRKAEELIEQKLKEKNFAFKDPRTIRLLPFWHKVFEKKEISPSYLLAVRNPLAVGYSLFRRNQFPLVKSFCLWLSHNVLPWPLYAPYLKAVVDYDRFLDQPEKELQRIAEVFSLPYDDQAVLVLKRNFLKQEYRHARFTDMDLERHQAAFYPLVESWKLFKAMATFSAIPREAKVQMDSLSKSFSAFQQLLSLFDFYNERKKKELAELYDREKKLGEELEEKKLEIRELKEKLEKIHLVNGANKEFIAKIFRDLAYSSPGKKKIWNRGKKEVDPEKEMAVKFMESGLFDPGYYWSCYPDVKKAGADPLLHYVRHGWKEGRNPNPYFDSAYYLEKNPEVKAAGVNPLLHFIENGWKEGRNPHPDFDLDLYLETQPELRLSGVNPLKHFLESVKSLEGGTAPGQGTPERGQYLKILRSSLFDKAYYLGQYPDVQEAGIDPLLHYVRHGWKEGRNPNPYFDSAYYLEKNPDVKAAGVNPLLHFIENGWKEGRNPHPDFDLRSYLERYPDVKQAQVNPLWHYLHYGRKENRITKGKSTPPWEISALMAPRKKALVFNDYLLVPDRRGGDFRTFQIIKIIRELGWEVNLAVLNDRENHGKVLQEDNLDIEFKHYEGILFEAGVKEILLGEEKIKTFLSRQGQEISVAYVFSPTVAYHFIPLIRSYAINAKLIYDPMDLAFIRLERKAALSKDPLVIEEAKQAKIIDTTNFVASDAIVAITEEEKEKILELSLQSRVEVVPNIHEVHKPKSPWENRKSILFLGYFGHEPNVDGLSYFILEMWESIREHIPGCSFEIVGSFLEEYVPEELLNRPGIQPVGYIPDLVPCFEKARVFVAPLRFGAGMKGKIGMAMASGLPVVTTSIGAEGMKLENGKNAFICDDKEEFIQAVVRLYKEKELWERLSQAALEHVESRYTKAVVKETLKKLFSFHCL